VCDRGDSEQKSVPFLAEDDCVKLSFLAFSSHLVGLLVYGFLLVMGCVHIHISLFKNMNTLCASAFIGIYADNQKNTSRHSILILNGSFRKDS
jgi:hypothetical protein